LFLKSEDKKEEKAEDVLMPGIWNIRIIYLLSNVCIIL